MSEAAVDCRRQALEFQGKPEAAFLLRLAYSFDELASKPSSALASFQRACASACP
jgi:hypothetical protein